MLIHLPFYPHWQRRLRGTVLAVMLALLACPPYAAQAAGQPVTLNFKDADIGAVIAVVADVTGKNFIIDPRVKARVTIISTHAMDETEIWSVFLSILEVHGFAVVPSGKVLKIVPDSNARQSPTRVADDQDPGTGDEVVTRIIELHSVSAAQLVPLLRPLAPQQAHMVAYPATNMLILSDRAANIDRLLQIIHRIDQPSDDTEVEILPLKHAAATEIVRVLNALDLEARKADPAAAANGTSDRPVIIADERTNSLLMGGGKAGRLRMRTLISHLDTPLESGGNIHVVYLRYAKAKDMVPVLTGVATQVQDQKIKQAGGPGAGSTVGGTSVQADEATNSLVITAAPDVFRSLQSVITQLDLRRAQVLIEAVIAEVSSSRAAELGVQWAFGDRSGNGKLGGDSPVGLINFNAGGSGTSIGEVAAAAKGGSGIPLSAGITLAAGNFTKGQFNFGALIRALEGDGSSNILSTPTLVTMDNVEAEIVVGKNVPFITGSSTGSGTGGGGTANPFQTIKRENVGLSLKVKPQINEGNAIKLDIEQKTDSLAPSGQGAADLITNTRSIKTSVIIDDGKALVLGGLITDDLKESMQKVPLLGDIPLIGSLFRYKKNTKEKTNLMVFLHPIILRDADLAQRLTNSKYSYIQNEQLRTGRIGQLLSNTTTPVLPPMEQLLQLPPPFNPPTPSAAPPAPAP